MEPYNEAMPSPPAVSQPSLPPHADAAALERARLRSVLTTVAVSHAVAETAWRAGIVSRTSARLVVVHNGVETSRFPVADALCVHFTGTLDYVVARSAMIWLSPWWMPLAWMAVSVQIGYLGARAVERLGNVRGAVVAAFLGAVNIPFYEEAAFHAHWWRYQNCAQIGHTPVYIIVAELFIGLALAPLARLALRGGSWKGAVRAGVWGGASTIAGGLIGFGIVEMIIGGRWSVLGFGIGGTP